MSNDKLQQSIRVFEEESKELALSLHREQKRSARLQSAIDSIAQKIVSKFPNEAVSSSLTLEVILEYIDRMVLKQYLPDEAEEPPKEGTKS